MLEMELWYLRFFWTWSLSSRFVDLFEHHVTDGEVDVVGGFRIEDSVAGFLGVWDGGSS